MFTTAEVVKLYLDEVCRAVDRAGCAPVDRAYPSVGLIAWDDCNQLTVGTERVYRSIVFPTEYLGTEDCFAGYIAMVLNVTLTRCAPSDDGAGHEPTVENLTVHHNAIMRDAAVIWNVLAGWMPDDDWERASLSQAFMGNAGGTIAIEHRVTVGLDSELWCP